MTRIMESVEIAAMPTMVARYLWDANNIPNYLPASYVEILETGENRVKVRHDFTAGGRILDLVCVQEMVEQNRKIRFRAEEGMVLGGSWLLQDLREKVKLTYVVDYELPGGILGKVMGALKMKKEMRKICGEALQKLKAHLEG